MVSKTKLLMLGCEPAGVELLKNLILPGLGYFYVVDNEIVEERDLGKNFFVSE